MDSQTIEIIGRNRVVNELLEAGIEVALPLRDRGIDLIAYLDLDEDLDEFVAVPIQMKASTRFAIYKKYAKFPSLLYVYVWGLNNDQDEVTYALTHEEAFLIAEEMGYTKTASWESGGYTATPSRRLVELLQPHVMSPETWREKILSIMYSVD
ncbi:MAG: hypothetical protein JXJ17_00080 [Anaerolineae bacterium]|nr:hypothetical protein [Anaerolineae bacterium]